MPPTSAAIAGRAVAVAVEHGDRGALLGEAAAGAGADAGPAAGHQRRAALERAPTSVPPPDGVADDGDHVLGEEDLKLDESRKLASSSRISSASGSDEHGDEVVPGGEDLHGHAVVVRAGPVVGQGGVLLVADEVRSPAPACRG